MGYADEVDGATAIAAFVSFICARPRLADARHRHPIESKTRRFVVVDDMIAAKDDVGSVHYQDSFELRVFYGEPYDVHVGEAGMIGPVDEDAVVKVGGVNRSLVGTRTEQG